MARTGDAPAAPAGSGPLAGLPRRDAEGDEVRGSGARAVFHSFQRTCRSLSAEPLVEFREDRRGVGQGEVGRPAPREAVKGGYPHLPSRPASCVRSGGEDASSPPPRLWVEPHLDLSVSAGRRRSPGTGGWWREPPPIFASFTRSFSRFSTNVLVLCHDPLPGPLALDVDHEVVGIADELVTSAGKLVVEVVQHDVGKERGERGALGGAFFLADLDAVLP